MFFYFFASVLVLFVIAVRFTPPDEYGPERQDPDLDPGAGRHDESETT